MSDRNAPGPRRHGLFVRIRYHLDNALTKGSSFVVFVFVATLVLAALMALTDAAVHGIAMLTSVSKDEGGFLTRFWGAFGEILNLKTEPTWADRIVSTLYWTAGIMVTGTVIGFITGKIQGLMVAIRQGRTPIVQSDHMLILGWSPRAIALLQELAVASLAGPHPLVVIFANKDREWMLQEIESQVPERGNLRIVTRRGDPTNPSELARANVEGSRCVVVLDGHESGDASAVTMVLSVRALAGERKLPVVVEVQDPATAASLTASIGKNVLPMLSQQLIARVTAQSSRQAGLGAVMLDLLDFDGQEIYFAEAPSLAGRSYREASLAFPEASVIGWVDPTSGAPCLNPAPDAKMPSQARIIAIAEDESHVRVFGAPFQPTGLRAPEATNTAPPAARVLFVGWSSMGQAVLDSLAPFLPPGSSVTVAARSHYVEPARLAAISGGDVRIEPHPISDDARQLTQLLASQRFDQVIVLGYRHGMSANEADAQTILTLIQVADELRRSAPGGRETRLIGEILDSRRIHLAQLSGADDLVVSDRLTGCMLAQLAENPGLAPVFEDLFDADGATVTMRPVSSYAAVGQTVAFGDLVDAAVRRGDSAIGYRSAGDGGTAPQVRMNPGKGQTFKVGAADALVVIGPLT